MKREDKGMPVNSPDELSIGDISKALKNAFFYVKTKWAIIALVSLLGAVVGFGYSIFKKPVYSAIETFVLEDPGKGGGLGQYAGLASMAGIDINSSSGGGIFQGDNIIELYKSRFNA